MTTVLLLGITFGGWSQTPAGVSVRTLGVRVPGSHQPVVIVLSRVTVPGVPTVGYGLMVGDSETFPSFPPEIEERLAALAVARALDRSVGMAFEATIVPLQPSGPLNIAFRGSNP